MLATVCTFFFALAAVAAVGTMMRSMKMYGTDVVALGQRYKRGEPDYQVFWRIVDTTSRAAGMADLARTSQPARIPQPVSRGDRYRSAEPLGFAPSLAA